MARLEREKDQKIIEMENKMVNMVAKLNLGETGALIEEFNEKLEKLQIDNLTITDTLKRQDNHQVGLKKSFDYLRTDLIQFQ